MLCEHTSNATLSSGMEHVEHPDVHADFIVNALNWFPRIALFF